MKWIIIIVSLFLLSSCGKQRGYVVTDYTTLIEKEIKCIIKNATPVNSPTNLIIDGKYYKSDDPNVEKCLRH